MLYRGMFQELLPDGGEQLNKTLITSSNVVEFIKAVNHLLLDVGLVSMAPHPKASLATLGMDAIMMMWEGTVRILGPVIMNGIISVMFGMAQLITCIMMENYILKDGIAME